MLGEHCPVLGEAGENEQRCRKNMTCKDSWKETGLFSLEGAGDRREEQSDAPQRAESVGFQLCSRRNHRAGSWSNTAAGGMWEGTAHRK